ncbi:MAG: hypothetical protein BGO12_02760 [Verrucomicrobia bacterium 61-8]|nr:MAG: hypothetical protein BGO12_02760 [Verrucomicrobia bacterium 61-8]
MAPYFLIGLVVAFMGSMCSHTSSYKTDGVYESATDKLNAGLPLNNRERQRLNDILNYKQNKEIDVIERRNGER